MGHRNFDMQSPLTETLEDDTLAFLIQNQVHRAAVATGAIASTPQAEHDCKLPALSGALFIFPEPHCVSRIMVPQRCPHSNPWTCEYGMLHDKGKLKLLIYLYYLSQN